MCNIWDRRSIKMSLMHGLFDSENCLYNFAVKLAVLVNSFAIASATLYSCLYIWRDWGTKTTGSFENPLSFSSNGFLLKAFIQSHMYPQCFGHTDLAPRFQLKIDRHSLSRRSLCWLPPLALGSSTYIAFVTTILQHTNPCNRKLLPRVSRRS